MPTDAAFLVASFTGLFGALAVTGVGVRFTRKLWVLVCSGVLSAVALGVFVYVLWGWFTHGFKMFQVSLPPLAAFVLLLVMVAQNWLCSTRIAKTFSNRPGRRWSCLRLPSLRRSFGSSQVNTPFGIF